jgi:GNAT superfamily N-acetyltransferase
METFREEWVVSAMGQGGVGGDLSRSGGGDRSEGGGGGGLRVVRAGAGHVAEIARLHKVSIDQGFLSELGDRFLRSLYGAMMRYEGAAVFVCLDGERVAGFSAVTTGTGRMYRWMMRHALWGVGWPLLMRMWRPRRIVRVVENVLYPKTRESSELPVAELLSVSVDREYRRRGIAKQLLYARLDWLRSRGVDRVRVMCTEGLKSNDLYRSMGLDLTETTEHHGKVVNVYTCGTDQFAGVERWGGGSGGE